MLSKHQVNSQDPLKDRELRKVRSEISLFTVTSHLSSDLEGAIWKERLGGRSAVREMQDGVCHNETEPDGERRHKVSTTG